MLLEIDVYVYSSFRLFWHQNLELYSGFSNAKNLIQNFGGQKYWIQDSGHPNSWIQDFGHPKSWIQDFSSPKSWIQDFGSPKSWIQDFGSTKSWIYTGYWQSLTLTLSHNSTEITLLLVNLEIFDFKLSAIMWKKTKHPKMRSDIWSSAVTVVTNNFKYMSSFVYFWFFGCQDRQTGAREAYKNASYWNGKLFVIFSFRSLVHFRRFLNCWPSVLVLPLSKSWTAKQL